MPIDSNLGLLSGLAEGLKQGLLTYQTMQNIRQQRQMTGAMHGLEQDENGNWVPNAATKTKLAAEAAKNTYDLNLYKTDSDETKKLGGVVGGLINTVRPGADTSFINGVSGRTLQDVGKDIPALMGGMVKQDVSSQGNELKQKLAEMGIEQKQRDLELKKYLGEKGIDSREDIANKRLEEMKDMFGKRMDMQNQRLELMNQRLQMAGNDKYSKEMHGPEDQLLAASKVMSLGKGIKAKDLVGTSQLKSDISAALAQMIANKPATVFGMQHQEFDSLWGRTQKILGFLSGETTGTITDAQLTQLMKDVQNLQKEYNLQREIKFNAFKANMPQGLVPGLEKRYETFGQGIMKAEEPSVQAHPQDTQALEWAKKNPNDPRASAILKANGM